MKTVFSYFPMIHLTPSAKKSIFWLETGKYILEIFDKFLPNLAGNFIEKLSNETSRESFPYNFPSGEGLSYTKLWAIFMTDGGRKGKGNTNAGLQQQKIVKLSQFQAISTEKYYTQVFWKDYLAFPVCSRLNFRHGVPGVLRQLVLTNVYVTIYSEESAGKIIEWPNKE